MKKRIRIKILKELIKVIKKESILENFILSKKQKEIINNYKN